MKVRENIPEGQPDNHIELRSYLVAELISNPGKYNLNTKSDKKLLKLMYNSGQQPCTEVILAACHLYNIEVHVYHGLSMPVIYRSSLTNSNTYLFAMCFVDSLQSNSFQKEIKGYTRI